MANAGPRYELFNVQRPTSHLSRLATLRREVVLICTSTGASVNGEQQSHYTPWRCQLLRLGWTWTTSFNMPLTWHQRHTAASMYLAGALKLRQLTLDHFTSLSTPSFLPFSLQPDDWGANAKVSVIPLTGTTCLTVDRMSH